MEGIVSKTELSKTNIKVLKGHAHSLKPVVWVGEKGLTESVIKATQEALETHELIKIRLRAPEEKKQHAHKLALETKAQLVDLIGHTVILFKKRKNKKKKSNYNI